MPQWGKAQADSIEIELIRSLYDGIIQSMIMSVSFLIIGVLIVVNVGDTILTVLFVAGALASIIRLWEARRGASAILQPALTVSEAFRLERRFAVAYLAFALILGLFAARTFMLPIREAHMVVTCMIVGYAAGVAAGIGLRPRLAIPSMVSAIVPTLFVALLRFDIFYLSNAMMMAGLLAGGIGSLRGRHRRAVKDIERRLMFATLARRDVLTALPNRLALAEWFDDHRTGMLAVHCLDLNGFKPVNDCYGHPVGDALLTAVARRLAGTVRESDLLARLGGDEFVVIQRDLALAEEAASLARRLHASLDAPFNLGEHLVTISTCVGYVVSSDSDQHLEQLIAMADEALYEGKRSRRPVVRRNISALRNNAGA